MHFIGVNLKLVADLALRRRIAQLTSTTPAGMLVGGIMIVVTQSASAAVFLLVGLVRAGMLTLRQAQPVILGINVGAGLILLFLTIDIRIAVLILIGVSGIAYTFGPSDRERLAGAAIGIGLLFLGLQIMREGAADLEGMQWFHDVVAAAAGSPSLALLAGAVLTVIAQSSIAVSAIMIVLLQSGLFGLNEAVMFVYGTNIGASILLLLLSTGLTGVQRQVTLYLIGFNFAAALILVPLFYLEMMTGMPLVVALVSSVGSNAGTQAALAYVAFNALPVPFLLLLLSKTARLLQSVSPQTPVELGSRPEYLNPPLPNEPSIALQLVELEQQRLLHLISGALDCLRSGSGAKALRDNLDGIDSLQRTIAQSVNQITSRQALGAEHYRRIDRSLRVLYTTASMRDALERLGSEIVHLRANSPELTFPHAVVEGLDAILSILTSVARSHDEDDIGLLTLMTSKEGNGTGAIRRAFLNGENTVRIEDRSHMLNALNYCERLIWLFGEAGQAYGRIG